MLLPRKVCRSRNITINIADKPKTLANVMHTYCIIVQILQSFHLTRLTSRTIVLIEMAYQLMRFA